MTAFSMTPIGRIRSCFPEKFGIPRQPGLVPDTRAVLEIVPPFDQSHAFRGLEDFSHIWLLFVFHQCLHRPWKPTVRPPRLGGNQRMGVFATRSGYRPNAIGQSVVELIGIECNHSEIRLQLGGIDLLDGTPVLDVKPYLPYVDSLPAARAGRAATPPAAKFRVTLSPEAKRTCEGLEKRVYPDLEKLIIDLLALDPRPRYLDDVRRRHFGMRLWDLNIRFTVRGDQIVVDVIEKPGGVKTSWIDTDAVT